MNKRWYVSGIALFIFISILLIIQFYISKNYINEYKRPIDIQVIGWDTTGNQIIYNPIQDQASQVRYIINGFEKLKPWKELTKEEVNEMYSSNKGIEYDVYVRKITDRETNEGINIISFTFYEHLNIATTNGVEFYKISDDFKEGIINMLETN